MLTLSDAWLLARLHFFDDSIRPPETQPPSSHITTCHLSRSGTSLTLVSSASNQSGRPSAGSTPTRESPSQGPVRLKAHRYIRIGLQLSSSLLLISWLQRSYLSSGRTSSSIARLQVAHTRRVESRDRSIHAHHDGDLYARIPSFQRESFRVHRSLSVPALMCLPAARLSRHSSRRRRARGRAARSHVASTLEQWRC